MLVKVSAVIKTLPNNRQLQIQLNLIESQLNTTYLLEEQPLQCINPLAKSTIVYRLPSIKREFKESLNGQENRYAFYGSIEKQPGITTKQAQAPSARLFVSANKFQQIFANKRLGLGTHPQI